MAETEGNSTRSRNIARFRWRLIPVAFLGIAGFFNAGWGVYCIVVWQMSTWSRSVPLAESIPSIVLISFGIVWIASAREFMKARWLSAFLTASIPLVIYILFVQSLTSGLRK